jgi:hypothetical protein
MAERLVIASAYVSNLVSQMTQALIDRIEGKFPQGYFKSLVVHTEDEAIREARRLQEGRNKSEFLRMNPALAVDPTYDLDLAVTEPDDPWMHISKTLGSLKWFEGRYPTVMRDFHNDIAVMALPKRHRVVAQVGMRVEGVMPMWDLVHYVKNSFIFDSLWYMKSVPLQSIIPDSIILTLARAYGLDPSISADRDALLKILRQTSKSKVEAIGVPSRGEDFYIFSFYPNVLTKFSNLSQEPTRKGQSNWSGEVRFTAEMDFVAPTNFALIAKDVQDDFGVVETTRGIGGNAISSFTVVNVQPVPVLPDGRQIVYFKRFLTDPPNTVDNDRPVLGPEKASGWTDGFSIENVAQHVPSGWNILEWSSGLVTAEESVDKDNPDQNTWMLDLYPAGITSIITDDQYTNARGKRFKITIRAKTSTLNSEMYVSFGDKEERKLEFTQPNVWQEFGFDMYAPAPAMAMNLILKNLSDSEHAIITISYFSVKEMKGLVFSDSEWDNFYLMGLIDPKVDAVIQHNLDNNLSNDDFFGINVYRRGGFQLPSTDIVADWENRVFSIRNHLYNYVHYLALYADLEEFGIRSGYYEAT